VPMGIGLVLQELLGGFAMLCTHIIRVIREIRVRLTVLPREFLLRV
jgi:hypothetical protein